VDSCGGFFSKVLSYAYMEEFLKNTLHNPPPARNGLPRGQLSLSLTCRRFPRALGFVGTIKRNPSAVIAD